jgi:hypothetical protein
MPAIRIYQLAKELGLCSRTLIEEMKARGLEHLAQDHMRTLTRSLAGAIREWSFFGEPLGQPDLRSSSKPRRYRRVGALAKELGVPVQHLLERIARAGFAARINNADSFVGPRLETWLRSESSQAYFRSSTTVPISQIAPTSVIGQLCATPSPTRRSQSSAVINPVSKLLNTVSSLVDHMEHGLAILAIFRSIEWMLRESTPSIRQELRHVSNFNYELIERCLAEHARLRHEAHQVRTWANAVRHPRNDPVKGDGFTPVEVQKSMSVHTRIELICNRCRRVPPQRDLQSTTENHGTGMTRSEAGPMRK